jgi:hypothetical protein
VPARAHAASGAFSAATCLSAKDCVAVGAGGGAGSLLLSRAALTGFCNGKTWKLLGAS